MDLVKFFVDNDKIIATSNSGPQVLSCLDGYLKGKKITSSLGVKHEMKMAGAFWEDSGNNAVIDGNLVSVSGQDANPNLCAALCTLFERDLRFLTTRKVLFLVGDYVEDY